MTHQEIEEKEIIERYVLHQLSADERRAFQEHYFSCDQCFEQAQAEARFIAGARDASRSGVLAADEVSRVHEPDRATPRVIGRFGTWVIPAMAISLLIAVLLIGLWALSLKRENQLLSGRTPEQTPASDRLRALEEKVRELEAGGVALQQERESLKDEINRLKEQLTASEHQREAEVAALKEPEVNVPVRNIYPVGGRQRSGGSDEINRVKVPHGTRTFVLILGDYKPGYSGYRLEVVDRSGHSVARMEGLKPDQSGELSVMLNRTLMSQSKYTLKLYGLQQQIAEYVIVIE